MGFMLTRFTAGKLDKLLTNCELHLGQLSFLSSYRTIVLISCAIVTVDRSYRIYHTIVP